MDVREASINDLDYISSFLLNHFDKINEEFGYFRYSVDIHNIKHSIKTTIESSESNYKYLVLDNNGHLEGCAKVEILIGCVEIHLIDVTDDRELFTEFLTKIKDYIYNRAGVKVQIVIHCHRYQKYLMNFLTKSYKPITVLYSK